MIEELKKKYPLAVDALKGRDFNYHEHEKVVTLGKYWYVNEGNTFLPIKHLKPFNKDSPQETKQIGEMLADFLNQIAKP